MNSNNTERKEAEQMRTQYYTEHDMNSNNTERKEAEQMRTQ